MDGMEFFTEHCEIHGEFCGEVHRMKRNGEEEIYPYDPVSPYRRTPLTIRNENIRRAAASVSNPQHVDYKSVVRKLYFYTPYILNRGTQSFLAETVFYVRERGDYEFIWEGNSMGSVYKVSKRTKLSFGFHDTGEKQLNVYYNGNLYCQRLFMITDGEDLDYEYEEWLGAHLEEVLAMPEPEYDSLKLYRRGLRSKCAWLRSMSGVFYDEVLYKTKKFKYKDKWYENPWMYHHKNYDHSRNPQTIAFNRQVKDLGLEWLALAESERNYWNSLARKQKRRRVTGFNMFVESALSAAG